MKETRVELHFYYNREAGFIYKMNKKESELGFGSSLRSEGKGCSIQKKKKRRSNELSTMYKIIF